MLDIKLIRKDKEKVEKALQTKEPAISLDSVFKLDHEMRAAKTESERLKSEKNDVSKKIGELKRKGEDASSLMDKVEGLADKIHALDKETAELEAAFEKELSMLPNIPFEEIPVSSDPKDNVCLRTWGPKPSFSFPFKNHLELNEKLSLFDFKRGAKLAGSGWPIYRGYGARLEWALLNYMISVHIKKGFEQWIPPIVVKPEILYGSGQLPKFENQQFKVEDPSHSLFLIPTAEVPLNGLHADEILDKDLLPLRYIAYTPCFRREAGAAGSQERGLIRTHQFNKVEMFCFSEPEKSAQLFEEMVGNAREILEGLNVHYREMLLVTGDMSFAGAKTIDIEVWLPGQNRYYEVSSITNCTDYQARRSQIRYRKTSEEKPELVHTLNGSGLATSRLMVALLENNQQEDGSVIIPEVLRPYLGGLSILTPPTK